MDKEIAIKVEHLSKTFRIPHDPPEVGQGSLSSVRGAVVNVFRDRSYEEFKALDDVSFEVCPNRYANRSGRVRKGKFFSMIGRNGNKKTKGNTLNRVLVSSALTKGQIAAKLQMAKTTRSDPSRGTAGF